MASKFFFSLEGIKTQKNTEGGSLTCVTSNETPGLVNISFANLKLKKNGVMLPIWHPNAHKIGYCTQGKFLVTIRSPSKAEVFTIEKGEIFFIPEGYVHHIENIDENDGVINFALNHTNPEVMCFSKAINSLTDSVFTATFNSRSNYIDELKKSKNNDLIKVLPKVEKFSKSIPSEYKFNIEKSDKPILTKGGYLQLGTKTNLPILQGLGILGFGLNPKGVVEPHWHTNAGELVYIVAGNTRITVLSPNGNVEVMEVNGGEGAFAPASHFHNIENIGTGDVEVIAFFSHDNPDYIGIGEVMGSFSNELLGSIFNISPSYFDSFTKPDVPLVIVPV